jgi:uncharacterized protein (TIGR02646 family)
MIRLYRDRTRIPSSFTGKQKLKNELELINGRKSNSLKFRSIVWKVAKEQLKKESCGKCAYCESPASTVTFGDVEHFRPKKVYWWLAYCYDNYVFACQMCNQKFKTDAFPTSNVPLKSPKISKNHLAKAVLSLSPDPMDANAVATYQKVTSREQPTIPDPYIMDPEAFFAWEADPVLEEVKLVKKNSSKKASIATGAVIKHLGLNREDLKRERFRHFRKIEVFRLAIEDPGIPKRVLRKIKEEIHHLTDASEPYAGMSRYFIRSKWRLT